MRALLTTLAELVGAASIVAGTYRLNEGVGLIVAGGLLIGGGVMFATPPKPRPGGDS